MNVVQVVVTIVFDIARDIPSIFMRMIYVRLRPFIALLLQIRSAVCPKRSDY